MNLSINLNKTEVRLKLIKNGRIIDFEESLYYNDLDTVLITTLDKLLKRNNIDTTALNLFKIRGNTGKNSTSYKITAAFLEALKTSV